jgi:hypothetical protein
MYGNMLVYLYLIHSTRKYIYYMIAATLLSIHPPLSNQYSNGPTFNKVYIPIYIHTRRRGRSPWIDTTLHIWINVCMQLCMYVCFSLSMWMYACMLLVCMRVVCICMYVVCMRLLLKLEFGWTLHSHFCVIILCILHTVLYKY